MIWSGGKQRLFSFELYILHEFLYLRTLAAVCLASISLLGILEIGKEIENPFGYDANDLVRKD